MAPDRIVVHNIPFRAPCGVFPEERRDGMDYRADIILYLDLSRAGQSDDLTHTVDYAAVADMVVKTAQAERLLVERLAEDIARVLLDSYPIDAVGVEITKLTPPADAIRGGVTIAVTRHRAGLPGMGARPLRRS